MNEECQKSKSQPAISVTIGKRATTGGARMTSKALLRSPGVLLITV